MHAHIHAHAHTLTHICMHTYICITYINSLTPPISESIDIVVFPVLSNEGRDEAQVRLCGGARTDGGGDDGDDGDVETC